MNAPVEDATFHAGERLLQASAGVAERMAEVGPRVIRRFMPEQHRSFFAQLPYVVAGALDDHGQPWATVLPGAPGFVVSPDAVTLQVGATPTADDPLTDALHAGAAVGLLGLEAHTRRRNRANGVVTAVDAAGFSVHVRESFGNCPKYIQARVAYPVERAQGGSDDAAGLPAAARAIVAVADTFFIATAYPGGVEAQPFGVDVSHRGGKPGFVAIEEVGDGSVCLLVPDFSGNLFFNTLGNIALNPRVGLLFIAYASGDLLHVAGQAEILLDHPALARFTGAQRLLRIAVTRSRLRHAALPLRWSDAELSPHLLATGSW